MFHYFLQLENIDNNIPLKDLFTSDKFSFIERLDSDIEYSKKLLKESQNNKDLIDALDYSLNNYLNIEDNNSYTESKDNIIQYTKNISELIDYNIKILKSITEVSNSIKQNIVNILIKTDENNNPQFDYTHEIYNFKNEIE